MSDEFDIMQAWPLPDTPSGIMKELFNLLQNHDALGQFVNTIQNAIALDIEEFNKDNLNITKPYQFVKFMYTLLTWTPTEHKDGKWVYKNIVAFYFIFNLDPLTTNQALQTPINPDSVGKPQKPLTAWLVRYAKEMGLFMGKTASWSEAQEKTFWDTPNYHMERYHRPTDGWKTFNEFFSRSLKEPNPVDGEGDDHIVHLIWSIEELISDANVPAKTFAEGQFVHAFLNTNDYHRQHAPVSGTVVHAGVVQGQCYLEVKYEPPAHGLPGRLMPIRPINPPTPRPSPGDAFDLDAPDSAGYQFLQTRGVIVIYNDNLGYVAVLPVGMAQVSSVIPTVKRGDKVKKGDEISYFQVGGSDIIMVFEKKANVGLTVNVNPPGTHMTQGQKVIEAKY